MCARVFLLAEMFRVNVIKQGYKYNVLKFNLIQVYFLYLSLLLSFTLSAFFFPIFLLFCELSVPAVKPGV